jgi:SAM-dependent methyltransferase
MDRAGLSPNDGPTHHGLFDIAYLRCIPNTIIMQPKDEDELADMLWTSLQADGPTFIRYPRGSGMGVLPKPSPQQLSIGRAVPVRDGKDIQFWALGPWVAEAEALAESIEAETSLSIGVVNARFAKPLDLDLLKIHARNSQLIVTFEDHAVTGGFGSAVMEAAHEIEGSCPVSLIGFPDNFVSHGSSVEDLRAAAGLSREALLERLRTLTSPLPKRRQIRLDFWKKWLSPDCPYPEDREERLKPDRELPGWALDALPGSPEETIILDVNAGPASTLGTRAHGRPIKLIAIDDLGNILDRVAGENNIHPPVPTVQCSAEDIQLRFGRQAFDLIYSCNGLDYTEDPISTYQQLYECLKPGGKIITFHEAAKDENQILLEGFRSFHELRDGEVFIRNLFSSKKLTSLIPSAKIKASEENGFIRVEIKMVSSRTWDMPLPELPSKESGLPSLISVHIPKTAGTSFGTFLENLYGKTFRPMYKPEEWGSDNYDLASLALEPGIRCLHGHFQATAYDKHLRDSMKVIWLRDPVERIVSSYLQYSREPGMERESTFNRRLFLEGWSLLDFARHKHICQQTEWYFDTMALSDFHFVGICEEFDASMKLFCHLLNIDVPKEVGAVNLNPNKKLGSKYSLPDAQYNQLAVILKEEIQLYRAACQRFNQQYHEAFGAQAPELATR